MVRLEHLTKTFGTGNSAFKAVDDLHLHIQRGEFAVLIGPSGCGKTTTLKMINHIIEPTSGQIYIDGQLTSEMNKVQLRRNIGYVIQSIGLFPHMTIAQNVGIVPRLRKWTLKQRLDRVDELLEMVGLDPSVYRDRYPSELSGGQQQRIGVLRALAGEPEIILMDEPFGALDPISRDQLQDELKELQQELKKTVVFVTHDMDEALRMADQIVLMQAGKPVQIASPRDMLSQPANQFVREFIGEERLSPQPETTAVSEIMIPNPLTVSVSTRLNEAMRRMRKARVGLAVVTKEDQRIVGIITDDIAQAHLRRRDMGVGDVLDEDILTVRPGVSVQAAASMLAGNRQNILLVVDRQQRCVGLLTRSALIEGIVDVFWNTGNANSVSSDNEREVISNA